MREEERISRARRPDDWMDAMDCIVVWIKLNGNKIWYTIPNPEDLPVHGCESMLDPPCNRVCGK
jgi:hypothetical protein